MNFIYSAFGQDKGKGTRLILFPKTIGKKKHLMGKSRAKFNNRNKSENVPRQCSYQSWNFNEAKINTFRKKDG